MMVVNISTGVLSSLNLPFAVSAIHWLWTALGAVTLFHVYVSKSAETYRLSVRSYWYMGLAANILVLEVISIANSFYNLSMVCTQEMLDGGAAVSQECMWDGVFQFHAVYLFFVHIMFLVLLNCCMHDAMKERTDQGVLSLYLNWHNFTALPFPALFFNMMSIVYMQKYIAAFVYVEEWNNSYILEAFWLVLKALAVGNIIFNVVIFLWFVQSHKEVSLIESILMRVPYFGERLNAHKFGVLATEDIEKSVPIV
ncbi:hypothetical protein HDU79_011676 [Rhizoclosmatium sp. JEL0117]|nr:hypothetical protein HDU79_011676 [Rhizoclosmatium sp. JEL0117]